MTANAKRNLDRFQGPLTPVEAAEGINATRRNARRLLDDATRLFECEGYPTALLLAIVAIEEIGKAQHIRGVLVSETETDRKRHWRAFRSHTAKNGLWLLRSYATANPRPFFHEVAWLVDADTDHARLADDVKQVAAYVDRYGEKIWSEPSAVIDKELAESFLRAAEILVPGAEVTVREMELWVEHIQPAMRTGRTTAAAMAWNDAMVAEGLKRDDRASWAAFLGLNDDAPE